MSSVASDSASDVEVAVEAVTPCLAPAGSWSHLRCSENIIDEAFLDEPSVPKVIRQLAAATEAPLADVRAKFAELFPGESPEVYTSRHVHAYAADAGVPC